MNPFEAYLVDLLQRQISLSDGRVVEVRREFMPSSYIPCITLDIVSDNNVYYRRSYDDGVESLLFKHECEMNIHVWANTEEEREQINKAVQQCYVDSLNHHYRYCSNYHVGQCKSIGTCRHNWKNKCKDPDTNGYECLSDKHNLVFGTVDIQSPFHMDERDEKPPVLHSVFRANTDYWETVSSMGKATQEQTSGGISIVGDGVEAVEEEYGNKQS